MNKYTDVLKECYECSSRDTFIKDGELCCNGCGRAFVSGKAGVLIR